MRRRINLKPWEFAILLSLWLILWSALTAGMWGLWCYFFATFWPSGPQDFIRPNYWFFIVMLMLTAKFVRTARD